MSLCIALSPSAFILGIPGSHLSHDTIVFGQQFVPFVRKVDNGQY